MLHIGLQVKDDVELRRFETLVNTIGIKSLQDDNLSESESGIYFISTMPISNKTLDKYSDEELIEEYLNRFED